MKGNSKPKLADPDVIDALRYQMRMYGQIRQLARIWNTERGVWVNEALVIRVCAVLEEYNVFGPGKPVQQSLPGGKQVEALRLARHCYAHSRGTHDRSRCRESDKAIREAFDLGDQESIFPGKSILSVETVLRPGVDACVQYCTALIELEMRGGTSDLGTDSP
jgi:hypothetical protein